MNIPFEWVMYVYKSNVVSKFLFPVTAPICFRNLTSPQNGSVTYNDSATEALYQCHSGFVLDGENKRICDLEGLWSGDSPNCTSDVSKYSNQHTCMDIMVVNMLASVL